MKGLRTPTYPDSPSFPEFDPHITLLTVPDRESPDLDTLRAAVQQTFQHPIPIEFKSVEAGCHYFRSVYIAVQPADAILELHAGIHKALGLEAKTPKFPHVSLCYIDDGDAQLRAELVKMMESDGRVVKVDDGVDLKYGPLETDHIRGFEGKQIWLMDCNGPVDGWKLLETFILSGVEANM
jgi:2',3'-cyclic-nucleotide 3'-phosphodiesterase